MLSLSKHLYRSSISIAVAKRERCFDKLSMKFLRYDRCLWWLRITQPRRRPFVTQDVKTSGMF